MKLKNYSWLVPVPAETIAHFGAARLVRIFDGHHELIGGTAEHHAAAREWCSLFAPEVVFNTGGTPQRAARHRWPVRHALAA